MILNVFCSVTDVIRNPEAFAFGRRIEQSIIGIDGFEIRNQREHLRMSSKQPLVSLTFHLELDIIPIAQVDLVAATVRQCTVVALILFHCQNILGNIRMHTTNGLDDFQRLIR